MPKVVKYTKGSIIFFEGDIDDRIFILQKGAVNSKVKEVETGNFTNTTLQAGEFFGVKSSIGHFPREETITALTECLCVVLNQKEFESLIAANKPILMKMMKVFTKQLRVIHQKIGRLLEDNTSVSSMDRMLAVAKAFYDDEDYVTCFEVLEKYFASFPMLKQNMKFCEIYKLAKLSYGKVQRRAEHFDAAEFRDSRIGETETIFSLPMFQRFMKIYDKGEVIIAEHDNGQTFFFIESGQVQLLKCANGKNKSLGVLKSGDFFGEMALLDNVPRSATCLAKNTVKVLEFNKSNFEVLITGNPKIAFMLLKILAKRIYAQWRSLEILTVKDPFDRIAGALVVYDELYPSSQATSGKVQINQSITDLAYWAGLSVDVTRDVLSRFVAQHKIELFQDFILVNNINDLKRIYDTRIMGR